MANLIMFIATGFYSGRLPKAPGTWGSLVGLALYPLLSVLEPASYWTATGVIIVIGVSVAGGAEKILDRRDPGEVVIDEIAGLLVALAGAPLRPLPLLAGFCLFRFFDIVKPFPIRWVDRRVRGGFGIMADDLIAGFYSLAVLQLAIRILG